jgi:hypothetical protein
MVKVTQRVTFFCFFKSEVEIYYVGHAFVAKLRDLINGEGNSKSYLFLFLQIRSGNLQCRSGIRRDASRRLGITFMAKVTHRVTFFCFFKSEVEIYFVGQAFVAMLRDLINGEGNSKSYLFLFLQIRSGNLQCRSGVRPAVNTMGIVAKLLYNPNEKGSF